MRTVSRALQVLDLFSVQRPDLRAAEAASLLQLDRATCFRILSALAARGYVTQNKETKKYSLGPSILRLNQIMEATKPTSANYNAILGELSAATQETTHASLIAGNEIASIACCDGLKSNRVHHENGTKLAWHATASGLTCLAYSDSEFVETVVSLPMVKYTENTITSFPELEEELSKIKVRGYGIVYGGYDADVTSIAAPVFRPTGQIQGAISVVTPSFRMTEELQNEFSKHVMKAANDATAFLAGLTP